MARVYFEGKLMDARTRDMFIRARANSKYPLVITQGCYNRGGVSASAGTHDGGGAIDIRTRNLTYTQKLNTVKYLRQVGFAAWLRKASEGPWVEHIHAVAIGCPDLSRGARYQVAAYKNGRNGLANNGRDNSTRAFVNTTWEKYKAANPVKSASGGAGAIKPVATGTVIHRSYIQYGARGGYFRSGQLTMLREVRIFVRWCNRLGVASDRDMRIWETLIREQNWKAAGQQLTGIIKNLQRRYRKPVDGIFGPVTGSIMAQDNYRMVP